MRKPDFFIAGAPKCGTTAMYAYLKSHPQVYMPDWKEPHHFGSDLAFVEHPRPDRATYGSLFEAAGEKQRTGEASVFYLLSEEAAREIHAFNPEARILCMFRDPSEMLYSFHSQRVYNGTEDLSDFREALDAEPERRAGRRLPRNRGLVQGLYYRRLAHFADQLERFLAVFPREQVHVLLYDDFKADPREAWLGVCRFLDIDESVRPDFEVVNANKAPRIPALGRLLWRPPTWVRALVPARGLRGALKRSIRRLNTRQQPRPPLDDATRQALLRDLAPQTRRLGEVLGRDLSSWLPR